MIHSVMRDSRGDYFVQWTCNSPGCKRTKAHLMTKIKDDGPYVILHCERCHSGATETMAKIREMVWG